MSEGGFFYAFEIQTNQKKKISVPNRNGPPERMVENEKQMLPTKSRLRRETDSCKSQHRNNVASSEAPFISANWRQPVKRSGELGSAEASLWTPPTPPTPTSTPPSGRRAPVLSSHVAHQNFALLFLWLFMGGDESGGFFFFLFEITETYFSHPGLTLLNPNTPRPPLHPLPHSQSCRPHINARPLECFVEREMEREYECGMKMNDSLWFIRASPPVLSEDEEEEGREKRKQKDPRGRLIINGLDPF